jgi:hypothetical protein
MLCTLVSCTRTIATIPDTGGPSELPCPVPCQSGYACVDLVCVPVCSPACPSGLVCNTDHQCVESLDGGLVPPNPCGGMTVLPHLPGDPCGACMHGHYLCAENDTVVCVDPDPINACGSCTMLPGNPGEPCAMNSIWVCQNDGTLTCAPLDMVNGCGGPYPLQGFPGRSCGACNQGHFECRGLDTVQCVTDPIACDCTTGPKAIACGTQTGRCTRGVRVCGADGRYTDCVQSTAGALCAHDSDCAGGFCVEEVLPPYEARGTGCETATSTTCTRRICRHLFGTRGCTTDQDCAPTQGCAQGFCHDLVFYPLPERCNGIDDDCDGRIDNDSDRAAVCGLCPNNMVLGSKPPARKPTDFYCIDRWEASRPDATSTSAGSIETYARPWPSVIPWTSIDPGAAIAACNGSALNDLVPGRVPEKRLCLLDLEWRPVCSSTTAPYPYGTVYRSGACNDSSRAMGLVPTGSLASCDFVPPLEAFPIFDMVGNASEWARGADRVGLAGGSFMDDGRSATCDAFVAPALAPFDQRAGFRCCAEIAIRAF